MDDLFNWINQIGIVGFKGIKLRNENDAHANELSIINIPVLLEWTMGVPPLDFSYLEMTLAETSDFLDTSGCKNIVDLTLNPNAGYSGLVSTDQDSRLILRAEDQSDSNQHSGTFKLFKATKRFLEYLYENSIA